MLCFKDKLILLYCILRFRIAQSVGISTRAHARLGRSSAHARLGQRSAHARLGRRSAHSRLGPANGRFVAAPPARAPVSSLPVSSSPPRAPVSLPVSSFPALPSVSGSPVSCSPLRALIRRTPPHPFGSRALTGPPRSDLLADLGNSPIAPSLSGLCTPRPVEPEVVEPPTKRNRLVSYYMFRL